jgi:hypothetical protein
MKKKLSMSILLVMFLTFCLGTIGAFAAESIPSTEVGMIPVSMGVTDAVAMKTLFISFGEPPTTTPVPLKVELKPQYSTEGDVLFDIEADGTVMRFSKNAFDHATESSKKRAMSIFIKGLQDSQVAPQTQQTLIDKLNGTSSNVSRMLIPLVMDTTSADIYTAMKWVKPILPIVRIAFGVGAIVVTLLLIASTIADLCFIGLPIARENIQSKGDQSKGGKIPFISADAMSVVKESEAALDSSGGYKNAYLMYFKRRVLTYIILSICLLYLVVGELGGLISWLLSLGSGVV